MSEQTPRTGAGRRLDILLGQADIRWPDDFTRIAGQALTPLILAIEAEARATSGGLDVERLRLAHKRLFLTSGQGLFGGYVDALAAEYGKDER